MPIPKEPDTRSEFAKQCDAIFWRYADAVEALVNADIERLGIRWRLALDSEQAPPPQSCTPV